MGFKAMRPIVQAIIFIFNLGMYMTDLDARKLYYDGVGITEEATKLIGVPYKFGGTDPSGFDCSGYTGYVYKQSGYNLPRDAHSQYNKMYPVRVPDKGDLVFFKTAGNKISHVGIYTGNFKFIHAPSSGKSVRIADIRKKYWKSNYAGARSIFRQDQP